MTASHAASARTVRIAHLGAGNFFRAHQAWYTEHAPDAADWGIAAYTGRGARPWSGGPYPLIVRAADGDRPETITSVVADAPSWTEVFALPELAVVTATVTEAGWRTDHQGRRAGPARSRGSRPGGPRGCRGSQWCRATTCRTTAGWRPGRSVRSLPPPIPAWPAGSTTRSRSSRRWSTGSPRAATPEDGPGAVVTEPFSEWVLAGEFPAGRPAWDAAGARFVDDVGPWERRKLWLLNGSHSLMAYAGGLRGHETVAEAIADPVVRDWVEQWWDVASQHLTHQFKTLPAAEIDDYRAALLERYANPRIRHLLAQIAADGSQKVPVRIWPVLHASLNAGHIPDGPTRILAAWICHLRGRGVPVTDVAAAEFTALAAGDLDDAVRRVLDRIDVPDVRVRAAVTRLAAEFDG